MAPRGSQGKEGLGRRKGGAREPLTKEKKALFLEQGIFGGIAKVFFYHADCLVKVGEREDLTGVGQKIPGWLRLCFWEGETQSGHV